MESRSSFHQQAIQQLDGVQGFLTVGMLGLSVRPRQVGMRVDYGISSEMMHMRKGNTPHIVTHKEHYQQVSKYGITQVFHTLPTFWGQRYSFLSGDAEQICYVSETFRTK